MVVLSPEIKALFEAVSTFPLATASKDGIPNVAPMGAVHLQDNKIWIMNNFMNKTAANLAENPYAAIYVYDPASKMCVQLKGPVTAHSSGSEYDALKAILDAKKPGLPAKELMILDVKDVYQCMPGPHAGEKIL
jgi:predicted pyridoxine 5'-phosphate oxidase superfamily flavin-nucleotide-binding protein